MFVPLTATLLTAAGGVALDSALPLDGLPASAAEVLLAAGRAASYGLESLLVLPEFERSLYWPPRCWVGARPRRTASEAGSG